MSLSINKNFSVPQLRSPDNYHDWLVTLRTYLETHDLWDFICEIPTQLSTVKGKSVEGEKKEATSSTTASSTQLVLDQALCEVLEIRFCHSFPYEGGEQELFLVQRFYDGTETLVITILDIRILIERKAPTANCNLLLV